MTPEYNEWWEKMSMSASSEFWSLVAPSDLHEARFNCQFEFKRPDRVREEEEDDEDVAIEDGGQRQQLIQVPYRKRDGQPVGKFLQSNSNVKSSFKKRGTVIC